MLAWNKPSGGSFLLVKKRFNVQIRLLGGTNKRPLAFCSFSRPLEPRLEEGWRTPELLPRARHDSVGGSCRVGGDVASRPLTPRERHGLGFRVRLRLGMSRARVGPALRDHNRLTFGHRHFFFEFGGVFWGDVLVFIPQILSKNSDKKPKGKNRKKSLG